MALIRRPLTPPAPVAPQPQIPRSLLAAGFKTPEQARKRGGSKFRGLMLATEGRSDSGKTEFMMSAPGPGAIVACDRGFDAVFDNPNPPSTRRHDFAINAIACPLDTDLGSAGAYLPYYQTFYRTCITTVSNPDVRTFGIDGDNFSWDLQRLAEWGKLQGVYPQTKYHGPNTARMSFYYQLWESGKIIITTNMLQDEWRDKIDPETGLPMIDKDTKEAKRERTGGHVAKGFPDQEYLWQIRIRHLYEAGRTRVFLGKEMHVPQRWGIRITKCKARPELIGHELWGADCNFAGLVSLVYPQIPLEDWGF